jgi:beta-aspartyl-peptidase (threonine type)
MSGKYVLAIHGGAGVLRREEMYPDREAQYHDALSQVLDVGEAILSKDGSALDAVVAAVCQLEDEPLFNAGRGAVFTHDGKQEMDAAVMDGRDRSCGAAAGIFGPKNPILAARSVLENTSHVLMVGAGAIDIAKANNLEFRSADYFFTEERWKSLQETLDMEAAGELNDDPARRHGTVGAVARDREGNLAAATSTGGMTAKRSGRVGDSPIIGAGTFANNASCAISATGDGEAFLRLCVAHEIEARVRLTGTLMDIAAREVVMSDLVKVGGSGGLIGIDRDGNVVAPFNCEGMYRGWSHERMGRETHIYA